MTNDFIEIFKSFIGEFPQEYLWLFYLFIATMIITFILGLFSIVKGD